MKNCCMCISHGKYLWIKAGSILLENLHPRYVKYKDDAKNIC